MQLELFELLWFIIFDPELQVNSNHQKWVSTKRINLLISIVSWDSEYVWGKA